MAKVNLKDAARELVEQTGELLEKTTKARRQADALYDTLKRIDAENIRRREEEAPDGGAPAAAETPAAEAAE